MRRNLLAYLTPFRDSIVLPFCHSAVLPLRLSLFSPFRLLGLFSLLSLFSNTNLSAQTCQDASVELSAVVQTTPPRITLNWVPSGSATQHFVYRKLKAGTSWGAVIGSFNGAATQFIDSTVNAGVSYEYRVTRQSTNYTGYGYINAGIEVPAVHSRGILILVVDETMVDSLSFEINRLKEDLEGDGWKVVQHNVGRNASAPTVKALIVGTYNQDKVNTKAVFLLGRIRVPYSGDIFPDGHPDHEGAWPADVYYADMNGVWTDNVVNVTVASDERHRNVPEDGKFDQSLIPTDVELQIGRVDFANMPAFAASEQELLRNYLDKDHAYRHKIFAPVRRGVVDDNFGYFSGEAFAASGWKNIRPLVGQGKIVADDYFLATRDSSYLWAYGCGGGSYTSAGGIGSTSDFAAADLQSVFSMLFGSYFGDWDATNNFLRAPLAQGKTLTNAWSGRPHWILHHMGLGENIGYSTRVTQNNNNLYFFSYGARFVHIALMGDPTLRNDVVAPPQTLDVVRDGFNHLLLWAPSTDPALGYYIYAKTDSAAGFILLNNEPHPDITFSHDCVGDTGVITYMVRAVALQQSPSGTYYNLSQGTTDAITGTGIPEVNAQATWEVFSDDVAFTNLSANASSFTWSFGDGEFSSEANPTHNYQDGFFNGNLIATNGCDADTFYFDILIFTGVKDINDDPSINVMPNPTSGKFNLSWTSNTQDPVGIRIFSLTGSQVYRDDALNNIAEVDLSGLPSGIYVLHIIKDGVRSMKRVVVQ